MLQYCTITDSPSNHLSMTMANITYDIISRNLSFGTSQSSPHRMARLEDKGVPSLEMVERYTRSVTFEDNL